MSVTRVEYAIKYGNFISYVIFFLTIVIHFTKGTLDFFRFFFNQVTLIMEQLSVLDNYKVLIKQEKLFFFLSLFQIYLKSVRIFGTVA